VVLDAEALEETRAEIAKHRAVLQGVVLIFVTTHPGFPIIEVTGCGSAATSGSRRRG
jgi:hypothetical protein